MRNLDRSSPSSSDTRQNFSTELDTRWEMIWYEYTGICSSQSVKVTGNPEISSIQGLLSSSLASRVFIARQITLLHLKPDPNAMCQTRSPFFTRPFAST
ncbi:hypothetical protein Hdeb2414_s0001g00028491 [Helianthus debilis subsp. tardiflorus]